MKTIFKSKTFWLAVTQAAIGVVAVLSSAHPDVGTLLIIKSLLDVILRYETSTGITSTQQLG